MLEAIIKRLKGDGRGISNIIVVMLSLVLIVVIVANVVLWSYQMNQLDWEKMQEDINIVDVISGARFYNPSGCALGGSTSWVSGGISNLASDDNVYMTFRSYDTSTDTFYPITNMNFTGSATGWTTTTAITAGTATYGYDGASGNPSPGSGAGSYYHRATGEAPKIADITFTTETSFSYTCGTPESVFLSYAYALSGNSFGTGSNIIVRLVKPDATTVDLDTVSLPASAVGWTYKTGITVSTTHFTQSGTYKLQVVNGLVAGAKGTANYIQLNFDDIGLKITYYNEYTVELEFTGTSNTESWTQLIWTIDSSFTAEGVTATFQLYNYNTSSYPTSGDGYMTDTIGTTDVTKTQTITTNPTHFRDVSGNWKMKVKAVKLTNMPFDFKADWIEFKPAVTGAHFIFQNRGPLTSHLISLWVNNATNRQRYDINLIVNSGENVAYVRLDISLSMENFVVKVVTERGNLAVFARH